MRRLAVFISALCVAFSLPAQTSAREEILDSLAYGSLNRMRFSNAVDNALYVMDIDDDRPTIEYAVFTYARQQMRERLQELSDTELRSLVGYVTSEPYRCLHSASLWNSFLCLLYDVVDSSVGKYPAIGLEINDSAYIDKADRLIGVMSLAEAVSSYVHNGRANIALAVQKRSAYLTAFDRMSRKADEIFKMTLLDYLSHEDLDYLLAFPQTDTGRKVSGIYGGIVGDFNYFLNEFLADPYHQSYALTPVRSGDPLHDRLVSLQPAMMSIADTSSREAILDFVVRVREVPLPYSSMKSETAKVEVEGGTYSGQVRNGRPHGKGTVFFTDGSREAGTYRDGLKNGFVAYYPADGGEIMQVWAQGRLVEPQSVGKLPDGSIPSVPLDKGMPYGYGACMKGNDTYIGQFVDGRLNGHGSVTGPDANPFYVETSVYGTFRNDMCEKGTRLQKGYTGTRKFQGRFYPDGCLDGEMTYYDSLGVLKNYRKGFIISDEKLDGPGIAIVYLDSLSSERRGTFVKGDLYGDAATVRTVLTDNGMTSSLRAEGLFWKNFPWTVKRTVETFTGIPVETGKARVLYSSGVRIVTRGTDSLSVVCEGAFEDNDLKAGRVSVSDGTWMEGEFSGGVQINGTARAVDKYSTIYEGEIMDGKYHGHGKCTYKDGTYFVGRFEKGSRRGGKHYSATGKLLKVLSD